MVKIITGKLPYVILITELLLGILLLVGGNLIKSSPTHHFPQLASEMLQGRLYFTQQPWPSSKSYTASDWSDTAFFKGVYYWPLGFLPSLVIMPLVVFFGAGISCGYVSFPLTLLNMYLLYRIVLKLTEDKLSAKVLTFSYIFGTAYLGVAVSPMSWYFSHVVTTSCLLSALYFNQVKDRPWLSGIFFTLGFLTRISVFLTLPFFLISFYLGNKEVIKKALRFLVPVLLGVLIFFTYNYVRFGDVFETGYRYQILMPELVANRSKGMWSIEHFPSNLYLFFINGPKAIFEKGSAVMVKMQVDGKGMGIIFTSPILLYLLVSDYKKKQNVSALLTALLTATFLFGSFGLGIFQYGYRFALDFQPFLFLILADTFKQRGISKGFLYLICFSALFNIAMVASFGGR